MCIFLEDSGKKKKKKETSNMPYSFLNLFSRLFFTASCSKLVSGTDSAFS